MKRLLVAAALAALCVPAGAADLQLKAAPSIPNTFPITGSGLYYGLYVAGAGGSADAKNLQVPSGINAASLTTTQGEIGGVAGYRWGSSNGMRFVDIEADVGWLNLNGNTAGLSLSGPLAAEVGARVGVPAAAIAQLFPTFNLPSLPGLPIPAGQSVLSTQMYVGAAARFEDISVNVGLPANQQWEISPALWVGMIQALSNGTALDARFEYIGPANACIGPAGGCATMGHRLMAKASMLF